MARPPFEPTADQRQTVAIAAGSGQMSHEEIAIGLGIDRKTLEKHFEVELSEGAYASRLEALNGLFKAAKKGNAAAVKAYLEMNPAAAPTPEKKTEADAPLGKKDQAVKDARTAAEGTGWGELLPKHGVQGPTTRQ